MNLKRLTEIYRSYGCSRMYVKRLSPNDNSKNQVYLGGNFEVLNSFPISDIQTEEAGDWKKERFKAKLNFSWIDDDGLVYPAPKSQLILYPKYPEVRFSGFLTQCQKAPSSLMNIRLANRLLFMGVTKNGSVLGYVCHPVSILAAEFNNLRLPVEHGVFSVIETSTKVDTRQALLSELLRIHNSGWINSKRLNSEGKILPCESSNCGGYTLEAELGITPNGYSEPDFLGWEIKQFGVNNLEKIGSAVITLMTPEPTHGVYKSKGAEEFIRTYGYADKNGRQDRMNFGGVHKVGLKHSTTSLELQLVGFDESSGKIRNANGAIVLVDQYGNEAASWSFSSLLLHWNRKHNQACYIPSMNRLNSNKQYMYGDKVMLGTGTDFQFFLKQMALGNIYYDPGIKMENISSKPKLKKRSQFRIKSEHLRNLYSNSEYINLSL